MSTSEAFDYWEARYRDGKTWSGNVNAALEREVADVAPGTALDLGSGEGGDALWLARRGWRVTAVDISPSAIAIGQAEQDAADDITWVAADLAEWVPPQQYDLVTASFLHSTVELPRERILRRAAQAVASGGLLVIIGHVGVPHWASEEMHQHAEELPTPDEVYTSLFASDSPLSDDDWTVVTNALVERDSHHGGSITDGILTLRRA
ncbi:SAM-dependent methyltransferase [Microbacteriaceae bacterium SG_E_30_P1]|uniref:SAM-dependent methyltransferase n=1 Tax=Antiquaquibacter oligotrophicus TaxID=2880260 RepID=A0ABT6KTS9_9MICO|nr:class I SAM-dependent methyltransferase [Antiquaquibacter oligotrophicus]MDH6182604.1 SAM-dependent methyltransferase [Antiquaquibacter oligotrophicus]UDF14431.1 class I SAM-dependent methyltransferase [Antiquaquibacter oligotrophicus]